MEKRVVTQVTMETSVFSPNLLLLPNGSDPSVPHTGPTQLMNSLMQLITTSGMEQSVQVSLESLVPGPQIHIRVFPSIGPSMCKALGRHRGEATVRETQALPLTPQLTGETQK